MYHVCNVHIACVMCVSYLRCVRHVSDVCMIVIYVVYLSCIYVCHVHLTLTLVKHQSAMMVYKLLEIKVMFT